MSWPLFVAFELAFAGGTILCSTCRRRRDAARAAEILRRYAPPGRRP